MSDTLNKVLTDQQQKNALAHWMPALLALKAGARKKTCRVDGSEIAGFLHAVEVAGATVLEPPKEAREYYHGSHGQSSDDEWLFYYVPIAFE